MNMLQSMKSVLNSALERGDLDFCVLLLEIGVELPADVGRADPWTRKNPQTGDTILHHALGKTDLKPKCIATVIKARPSLICTVNNSNEMPVQVAVRTGVSLEIVLMLLEVSMAIVTCVYLLESFYLCA